MGRHNRERWQRWQCPLGRVQDEPKTEKARQLHPSGEDGIIGQGPHHRESCTPWLWVRATLPWIPKCQHSRLPLITALAMCLKVELTLLSLAGGVSGLALSCQWYLVASNVAQISVSPVPSSLALHTAREWVRRVGAGSNRSAYQASPGAAVANGCKLGGLKQQECLLSPFGDQKCEMKVLAGCGPSKGPTGGSFHLFHLLVVPGAPWLVAASLQSLRLSSHGLLPSLLLSLPGHLSLDLGPTLHPESSPLKIFN